MVMGLSDSDNSAGAEWTKKDSAKSSKLFTAMSLIAKDTDKNNQGVKEKQK